MRLQGKVALITGAGTGIGTAVTEAFVREGAKVCITGRRREMLEKVAQRISPSQVTVCAGDVAKAEDVQRMVESAVAFGGKLDVVVNNAGVGVRENVVDLDLAAWQQVMDINLTGPFLVMKYAIPHLLRAGGGSIINVASVAAVRAIPCLPSYCASKSGLLGLSRQVAIDYGAQKIRSNAILPGGFRSEMFDRGLQEASSAFGITVEQRLQSMAAPSPLKRIAFPEEIAPLFVYLASDESLYTTAGEFFCDAGVQALDASTMAP
jgi:meso-butanediol dehydrogenase / (S,S)-butanediol dehydrogenase / diacetyl reductase